MKLFTLIDNILEKVTKVLLLSSVAIILSVAVFNIIARWFQISFMWGDPLIRHLVLLASFFGATLAIGSSQHIRIDVLSRLLEAKEKFNMQKKLNNIVGLISLFGVSLMAYSGFTFMLVELEYGKKMFFNIHSGFLVAIIPLGFSLMVLRYFCVLLKQFEQSENV